MKLSPKRVEHAKPDPTKAIKLSDGRGLHLFITPKGAKLWRMKYRLDGKEKLISFGAFPDVSLAQARDHCDTAKKHLAAGLDPMAKRRSDKEIRLQAAESSFAAVAKKWWDHWQSAKSRRHAEYVWRRIEADINPELGARPISSIVAPDLVKMVRTIEKRGALDIAKRAMQTVGQIFRFALVEGYVERNPAADVRPADVLKPRTKVNYARIDERELPELLRKIEGYQGAPITRIALKLMALTFVRTSELINARWEEFDLDGARWKIPPSRMKMKAPHIVPLSRQAVEALRVLHIITGERAILFPGERDHAKSMSNNTILKALERMGFKGRMTGHGFRGLASTILHEREYDHAHIELQLAHSKRDNAVSAAYNHAFYFSQRAVLMQDWADYLDATLLKRSEGPTANSPHSLVPIAARSEEALAIETS